MSSVCPSVTLVSSDHIGWKSSKLTAQTISQTHSLSVAKRPSTYILRGTWINCGETRGGVGIKWRSGIWRTKVAISLKLVKIEEKLLWTAYRNSPTLFRTVPSPTPYAHPLPYIGGSQPPPETPNSKSRENECTYMNSLHSRHIGFLRGK